MPLSTKETEPWYPLKVGLIKPNCYLDAIIILCFFFILHTKIFPGELAHALRFLASVVSQSFLAFGDILELHRKFLLLSGGINRIFELEELLDAAQSGIAFVVPSQSCHKFINFLFAWSSYCAVFMFWYS